MANPSRVGASSGAVVVVLASATGEGALDAEPPERDRTGWEGAATLRDDWREAEGVALVDGVGKGPLPSSERISDEVSVCGSEDSIWRRKWAKG